ncbi:MAG: threonylcarbamoyl-AMP synthase [Opitutae bacterium]|nr:threonylcarbamoyl-AMP synthase [Opitutae bacterium]
MSKITTSIYRPTPANLRRLAAALRRGELVAVPTETVYGLAANALDARACRRIFAAKRRPTHDPLIVHVLDLRQAAALAEISPAAEKLARRFWPGPLTLVLPRRSTVPDIVTAGRDSVAIRSPVHLLARRLLRLTGLPLAAPSANPFGYVSPTTAAHVRDGLVGRIRHILDGGPCRVGVESTIVDMRDPARPKILRPGAISREAISRCLHRAVRLQETGRPAGNARGELAPGMLEQHYSPRTPLVVVGKLTASVIHAAPENSGFIYFEKPSDIRLTGQEFWLSRGGDAREAARNLYAVLRRADQGRFARLWVEAPPGALGPLAGAINDRLRRASAGR